VDGCQDRLVILRAEKPQGNHAIVQIQVWVHKLSKETIHMVLGSTPQCSALFLPG
jgi:hypothetical protein